MSIKALNQMIDDHAIIEKAKASSEKFNIFGSGGDVHMISGSKQAMPPDFTKIQYQIQPMRNVLNLSVMGTVGEEP